MRPGLSKSRIMIGLQCPKRLWFELNPPEDYECPGEEAEFRFSQGHRLRYCELDTLALVKIARV